MVALLDACNGCMVPSRGRYYRRSRLRNAGYEDFGVCSLEIKGNERSGGSSEATVAGKHWMLFFGVDLCCFERSRLAKLDHFIFRSNQLGRRYFGLRLRHTPVRYNSFSQIHDIVISIRLKEYIHCVREHDL
jgi:hypothetical protein